MKGLCCTLLCWALAAVVWFSEPSPVIKNALAAKAATAQSEQVKLDVYWNQHGWQGLVEDLHGVCAKQGEKVYVFGPGRNAPIDYRSAPWRRWASCKEDVETLELTLYRQASDEFSAMPPMIVVGVQHYSKYRDQ